MRHPGLSISRPTTPETPLTSSLHLATSTMDDLTVALANFSKIPSPEPPSALVCCCGEEGCENNTSWLAMKSRLESRLILSAGRFFVLFRCCYLDPHQRSGRLCYSGMRHMSASMRQALQVTAFDPFCLITYFTGPFKATTPTTR